MLGEQSYDDAVMAETGDKQYLTSEVICTTLGISDGVLRSYLAGHNPRNTLIEWFNAVYGPTYGDTSNDKQRLPEKRSDRATIMKLVNTKRLSYASYRKPVDLWKLDDVWAWALYHLVRRADCPDNNTPWRNAAPINETADR